MAIDPLGFDKRAEFGVDGTTGYNPKNGNPIKGFVASFSRWFGYRTQNLTQQYTFAGNNSTETILIAIRHDDSVVKTLNVKIDDTVYSIYNISPDKSFGRDTVDLITLQKVVKNG